MKGKLIRLQRKKWKHQFLLLLLLAGFYFFTAITVMATPVTVIKGGTIYPIAGNIINNGTILIEEGKIKKIGLNIPVPANATIIEAQGKVITPGFIDSYTHLGLVMISSEPSESDLRDKMEGPLPYLKVMDAFNPSNPAIEVTRIAGVTTALVAPLGDTVFGINSLFKLDGNNALRMALVPNAAINANLAPVWSSYSRQTGLGTPSTRMGYAAFLRNLLIQAQEYKKTRKIAVLNNNPLYQILIPKYDPIMEALLPILEKKLPLMINANRASDILNALYLKDKFNISLIIRGGTEGYKVTNEIAKRNVPVIVGPLTKPSGSLELQNSRLDNPAILARAGIKIAFQTGETHNIRNLPIQAGIAVAHGLPYNEALKAVTLNPAEIFGIKNKTGTLEPGKDADIVIWNGDPLEPATQVEHVFINGVKIPLKSRQTELFNYYK